MAKAVKGCITILVFGGAYLFLAGSIGIAEGCFAVVAGAAAALYVLNVDRVAHQHLAFRVPLRAFNRPLAALLPETLQLGRVLIASALGKPLPGAFVLQPFDHGGSEPIAAGRRAVVLIGSSLAPRSFVIRGDREANVIMHSLPPKPPSEDRQWLA